MSLRLTLRPGATLTTTPDGLRLGGCAQAIVLPAVEPGVASTLALLTVGGATEQELSADVVARAGTAGILPLHSALHRLRRAGALCHTASSNGAPLVTLVAQAADFRLRDDLVDHVRGYVLSRFAYIHRTGDGLVVESPLGSARAILHGPPAATLLASFAEPAKVPEDAAWVDAANLLCNAAVLVTADADGERHDAPACAADWWEFHDLLFHARTRHGRHSDPYGGTSHRKAACAPPPVVKAPTPAPRIALARPDLEQLARVDPPFSAVLEQRRSVRDYGERAIGVDELGEFLYRALRVQRVLETPPGEMDLSLRPHPGGGAIHELEVYVVVGACAGLERGIYHYDAVAHDLEQVAPDGEDVAGLLHDAWVTADRRSHPQIYLSFTARYQRMGWKYQSIVYSVILKNVGAVYQTMYLVATAMGLAPSALGGGHVERFALAAGLDPLEECPVGEFVLGTLAG